LKLVWILRFCIFEVSNPWHIDRAPVPYWRQQRGQKSIMLSGHTVTRKPSNKCVKFTDYNDFSSHQCFILGVCLYYFQIISYPWCHS